MAYVARPQDALAEEGDARLEETSKAGFSGSSWWNDDGAVAVAEGINFVQSRGVSLLNEARQGSETTLLHLSEYIGFPSSISPAEIFELHNLLDDGCDLPVRPQRSDESSILDVETFFYQLVGELHSGEADQDVSLYLRQLVYGSLAQLGSQRPEELLLCEVWAELKFQRFARDLKNIYKDATIDVSNVIKWMNGSQSGESFFWMKNHVVGGHQQQSTLKMKTRSNAIETLIEHLGYIKICSKWVPRKLTPFSTTKGSNMPRATGSLFGPKGHFFFNIVTGDETWAYLNDLETKAQSLEWHHLSSPKKDSVQRSSKKVMTTVLRGMQGVILIYFLESGITKSCGDI
ncbi:hypothetical protein LAZ67_X001231 [Cordylochernes scorpioides]|uniref:Uncharacterized protein n=1 Tax=Cordylochernes scorpioides TaxID=51811 RepID=A0ABY6LS91_9ARAC|nr:hypothetical protein LAZ67_X001231 [Cordylochernes scorpioides]